MEAIVALIIEYAAIWGPAIVAILGVVGAVIPALLKIKAAIAEFRQSDDLKQIVAELKKQGAENAELRRLYGLTLDELTKIKGYAEAKKKEDK